MRRNSSQGDVLLYRGTQGRNPKAGVRGVPSFTPALGAALIWSAAPGDPWSNRKTQWLETSTVHAVRPVYERALFLGGRWDTYASLSDVLRALRYGEPGGIPDPEVLKIFNYMHRRLLGKAPGGEFQYQAVDEDGDPIEAELFSTPIATLREDFEWASEGDEALEVAGRLAADTFIFADAPAVQRSARAQGFDALEYMDVFAGGDLAAEQLMGIDVLELEGIDELEDLEDEEVPGHRTVRPLQEGAVEPVWSASAWSLAEEFGA